MLLSQANQILDQNPHSFEDGFKRLENGHGFIAARTEMPRCSGKMIEWWFSYIHTTEEYKQWHPGDHIFSDWKGPRKTGAYIGGTHLIHERLGTSTIHKLRLNFREPSTILDTSRFNAAGVSAAIYGRGGPLYLPLWSAHVLHLVHDTADGCVMRSRFWLGDVAPAVPLLAGAIRRDMTQDASLAGLHKHCREEMTILASFLPALYRKEATAQSAKPMSSPTRSRAQEQFD